MRRLLVRSGRHNPLGAVCLGAVLSLLGAAGSAWGQCNPAVPNDCFANATVISGQWGSVTGTNIGATAESGEPSHAGQPATASIWYQWTAQESGEVTFDTIGSVYVSTNRASAGSAGPLDTVLAVYSGSSLGQLLQVAANDDYYPLQHAVESVQTYPGMNVVLTLITNSDGTITIINTSVTNAYISLADYNIPLTGPSILRFNAQAGNTYYLAVDTKSGYQGTIQLNWAFRPSGVFRFASEDYDLGWWLPGSPLPPGSTTQNLVPPPLYQASSYESLIDFDNNHSTYYTFDPLGVEVTVTRVAGSSGRMYVDYTTVDGTAYSATNTALGVTSLDYQSIAGTLVFDDFEMSKTLHITVYPSFAGGGFFGPGSNYKNFFVALSNPRLAPLESTAVSPPRLDTPFATATVRILSLTHPAVPAGPAGYVGNNGFFPGVAVQLPFDSNEYPNNSSPPSHDAWNFVHRNYRVPRDINNYWTDIYIGVVKTAIYVSPPGDSSPGDIRYRVNGELANSVSAQEINNFFPLTPGSDYAIPLPAQADGFIFPWTDVTNYDNWDFSMNDGADGTIHWITGSSGYIAFRVRNNAITKFNKDFNITLYRPHDNANWPAGEVAECHVTILFDDNSPPAGSVDENYNVDWGNQMVPPVPTTPSNIPHPGTDGDVWGLAVQPDDKAILVGQFATYNGIPRSGIARALPDGSLDTAFLPFGTSGANDGMIAALQMLPDGSGKMMIGGTFGHYNGTLRQFVARLNSDGTLDPSFNPPYDPDGPVWALTVLTNNQVIIAGGFENIGPTARAHIARLNADGSLDTTFDPGLNTPDDDIFSVAVQPDNKIVIGGQFTGLSGSILGGLARLNSDGTADTNFNANLNLGVNGIVYSVALQNGSKIVIGGEFTQVGIAQRTRVARLNPDGSVDSSFNSGTGADDTIYSIAAQPDGSMYIGGIFNSYNGTRRAGLARLLADGTVDTSWLDTAFNQFAGLHRRYFDRQAPPGPGPDLNPDPRPYVFASQVLPDGNVVIGGRFKQVGGGQANTTTRFDSDYPYASPDTNVWTEPKSRDGVRNRNNFARLIGGSTPGPGNISLLYTNYAVNRSQQSLDVDLFRENGTLGYASANFRALPGVAQSGVDYTYYNTAPVYLGSWWPTLLAPAYNSATNHSITRCHIDGYWGTNELPADVYNHYWYGYTNAKVVFSIKNTGASGSTDTQIGLANPAGADTFFLGGQDMPVGLALGFSQAPLQIADDSVSSRSGTIGFLSATYSASEGGGSIIITIVRTNGTAGFPSVTFSTSDGTARAGSNYLTVNKRISFNPGVTTLTNIVIPVLDDGVSEPNGLTVNLRLSSPQGAALGLANAVLKLVDNDYAPGYVTFSATNYSALESSGTAVLVVNRAGASRGTVTVQCATTNVTAVSGVNYIGFTNTLTWNDGDSSPRVISVPLIKDGLVGPNTTFKSWLSSATVNGTNNATGVLSASPTVSTVTIVDDDAYGNLQFSAPSYLVNENGGFATITVIRTSGSAQSLTVNYSTSDGTAVSRGTLPNYVATSGVLTFNPGEVAKSFTVPVLDDGVVDLPPNQFFFNVTLSGLTPPGAAFGFQTSAQIRILDAETYNYPAGSGDTAFTPNPGLNGDVLSLSLQTNGQIVAVGSFTTANNYPRNGVARYNSDSSLDIVFMGGQAGARGQVNSSEILSNGRLLIGGAFTNFDSIPINRFARLLNDGTLDTSMSYGSGGDNSIFAVAEVFVPDSRLLIGGSFVNVSGTPHSGLARMFNDGTLDSTFDPTLAINGTVYAIAVYPTNSINPGKIMVAGAFSTVNGQSYNGLVRLNSNGTLDPTFTVGTGFDSAVRAVAIQLDGRVVVGGSFLNYRGSPRTRIARLNIDGSLDATFNPNASFDDTVNDLALQADNRIVVVGQFTHGNGVSRNRITRLLADGTTDPTINFGLGADGFINSVAIQPDGMILIGGGFTHYDGLLRSHLARIYGGSITGSGVFTFAAGYFFADEDSTNAVITVRRRGGTAGNVSVDFATSDGTDPVTGSRAGINYSNVVATLHFPVGETLQTVLVPVIDDGRITPDLTNNLTLSNASPPAGMGDQSTANLVIFNDESSVSFDSATYRVTEDTQGDINVLRSGSLRRTALVDFMTTTNGTAWPYTNYIPVTNHLVFNPGISNVSTRVPVLPTPGLAEGDKTVGLLLTNANHALLLAPYQATLTIVDLDQGPGQFVFSQTNYTVGEAAGYAFIGVLRTNGHSGVVGVSFATTDGSATSPYKYSGTNGLLTFQDGETSKLIAIPINQVSQVTGNETFYLSLFNPTNGATILNPATVPITIVDNNIGVGFASPIYIATETDGTAVLGIERVGASGITTVQYATTNGTALAGTNYVSQSGSLLFTNGEAFKTIAIPLLHDPQVTGPLSFSVNLFNASAPAQIFTNNPVTVTINDADPGFAFTNANFYTVKSGTNILITVVRSNANTGVVAVNYATSDDTASAGLDYTAVSGTLTFSNGVAFQSFTVPILTNSLVQGDRDFEVLLANPVNLSNPQIPAQLLQPNVALVTITDNVSGLTFSAPSYKVNENGVQATISVQRTGYTNSTVSVDFATANGTAIGWPSIGFNYYPTNGTFTFTNGETTKTFAIQVNDDNVVNGDKTVLLSLANPRGNAVLVNPSAAVMTIVESDGSLIVPAGTALTSESVHPPNGAIDPGETVTVLFAFRNAAGTNTVNMTATLLATNGVINPSGTQTYGALITHGPVVSMPFTFTANATNGQIIAATFHLQDGANNLGQAVVNFIVGQSTSLYSNSAAIVINDATNAMPYPSAINVSGLVGTVAKAVITVTNLNHTWPRDIDALLVSPSGQKSYLMAKAGSSVSVNNVTLTFDDASSSYLPQSSQLLSGTYHPTSYALVAPSFPSPAPPSTTGSPYATNLSVFNGSNPNGLWSLYIVDDTSFNSGSISNGWMLSLSTATPIIGNSDLGLGMTATPASAIVTSNVTYTISLINYGPSTASSVVVNNPLPAGAAFVSGGATLGSVTTNAGAVTWNVSSLALNGSATLTLVLQPTSTGFLTNTASVSAGTLDLNPDDDIASVVTTVVAPSADLALGLSGAPNPVLVGQTITYSMIVSNLGSATATNVSLSNTLPPGVALVSASPAGYTINGSTVTFTNLGNVGSGGLLTATIVARPSIGATLTDSASCASGTPDPRKLNNSASVKTVVEAVAVGLIQNGRNLVLSWTPDAVGYVLESATNLAPPVVWTSVTNPPPTLQSGLRTVTIPIGDGTLFFRLRGQTQ